MNLPSAPIRTAKVGVGSFERTLRIGGVTSARNFASIVAPMMRGPDAGRALILIHLAKSGSLVKKGDLIAQIDTQGIKDHVSDIDAQVQAADADIRKRAAEQQIEMENLRQSIRVAKSALDKAKLDNSAAEIRMPIDKELLQLAVEEAEAEYKELQQDLDTKRIAHQAEIRILEYTRDRHARHRDRHQHDIDKFTMYAPMGGLVVMNSVWRSGEMGQVQEGEQVSPGQPFMKIVDSNSMQVEASINQVESEGIRIGQPVVVHFDAFPDLQLKGKVQTVGAMGSMSWRQNFYIRNIPVKIAIQGSDPRVIPDLSASVDILCEHHDNVLLTPLEAVHTETGKPVVFIREGNHFRTQEVKLGARNPTQAIVLSGLQSGQDVALQRPASLAGL